MLNPRKLAAIDVAFLGPKFVIAEFAGGVVLCFALGVFVLLRSHSSLQFTLSLYLVSLGIYYVPLLAYAVAITRKKSARSELGDELKDERKAMSKYRQQSMLLLVPLLVPILSLLLERRIARATEPSDP